ncbi:hypothetical protein L1987_08784 [Smallanthus sonchifolius]|uniref:Uncharacterized protein n=1 Tax=Smallanthus sonchifolius TaxID=185202 RepID=A0ACB9JM48_9ASTR|nr:hypothetical protein L1987_08784 [Smallanthus sonchifolius]
MILLSNRVIQRPLKVVSIESGPNEDNHRYSLVGSFQSDLEPDTKVRPDPINQEESDDPFFNYNVIEELNNKEKSKVDHVTTESEHVEAVAVKFVVPSHQEAINKGVVDITTEVVNEPQETTEGPVVPPFTPLAAEDFENRNTFLNIFGSGG